MAPLKPLTVIGLNSGTSMDGVDAAAFRIIPLRQAGSKTNGATIAQGLDVEMIDAQLYPLEPAIKRKMHTLIVAGRGSLDDICRLNFALGEIFAQAALSLMKSAGLSRGEVDLIGSHGQTIWHAPGLKKYGGISTRSTLQLGEAAVIAARTGIPVIADFRVGDIAAGGQGAPLVAFADQVLFGGSGQATGVLNIGGIANITIIDDHGEAVQAFDTGPGNMLIDRAVQELFQKEFDEDGRIAASGKTDPGWLSELMQEPYFAIIPPKTTGREVFGHSYADQLIDTAKRRGISDQDIVATLTALTAAAVATAYSSFVQPSVELSRLVLGGGGAENSVLRRQLVAFWPHPLKLLRHEDFGISTKFKEALLFALLAYTTHFGIANNVPRCTGAHTRICLGKICRS